MNSKKIMRIIGLTGGVASGKTTASDYFKSLGAPIIDADVIARELTQRDQPAFQHIISHFGHSVLDFNTHQLNRKILRELIFNDNEHKKWLEQLLHPLIQQRILQEIQLLTSNAYSYCIVVIPLLDEINLKHYSFLHEIVVIQSDQFSRKQRLIERDHIEPTLADTMLDAHITDEDRARFSAHIIHNSSTIQELHAQLDRLNQKWTS